MHSQFKKYWTIIRISWQRQMEYRGNILLHRLGMIMEILLLILLWSSLFAVVGNIRGFSYQEMITYYIVGNIINALVMNWAHEWVAEMIKMGSLSRHLIQPYQYFWYMFCRNIGARTFPALISLFLHVIIILFFINSIIVIFDAVYLSIMTFMIILAFIIEFLISFLIGLVAFWLVEVDGLFNIVNRLRRFFAGGFFPLNLMPIWFLNISFFLPFAYSFYVPTQLYLKKIDLSLGAKGLAVQAAWVLILYAVISVVWKRGLKKYEGVGI